MARRFLSADRRGFWRGVITTNDPESDVRLNRNPLSCPAEWEPSPDADDFIRLRGSACTEFKSGQATFTAEFPCGSIVVE